MMHGWKTRKKISLTTISTLVHDIGFSYKELTVFQYLDESHFDRRLLGRKRGYGINKTVFDKHYTPGHETYSLLFLTQLDAELIHLISLLLGGSFGKEHYKTETLHCYG